MLVPLFLLLYSLSTGPVVRYYQGKNPPKWVQALYYPVQFLHEKTPLQGPIQRWVDLWRR